MKTCLIATARSWMVPFLMWSERNDVPRDLPSWQRFLADVDRPFVAPDAAGAEVIILFKDLGDGVRLSIRTRDEGVDATALAGSYGGGGHARAAGAEYDGDLAAALPAVLARAQQLIDELYYQRAIHAYMTMLPALTIAALQWNENRKSTATPAT